MFPYLSHEGVWGSGGISPLVLKVVTVEDVDWIQVAQNKDRGLNLLNMVMNHRFRYKSLSDFRAKDCFQSNC
jgi:hypothetical protein